MLHEDLGGQRQEVLYEGAISELANQTSFLAPPFFLRWRLCFLLAFSSISDEYFLTYLRAWGECVTCE